MKKIVCMSILIAHLSCGMSQLQEQLRHELSISHPAFVDFWSGIYKVPQSQLWLLEEIVSCSDGAHGACNKMRVYFDRYAQLACPYGKATQTCIYVHDALLDEQFMGQLIKDHGATHCEAEDCEKLLAKVSE